MRAPSFCYLGAIERHHLGAALDCIQRNSELDVHMLAYVGFRTVE
ncbi:hypothetical protein PALU110988_23885 [Paenibacillus lupini]|nr:hypothetical protein [Paenibacillus lupini]